jgi:hypothetical protein
MELSKEVFLIVAEESFPPHLSGLENIGLLQSIDRPVLSPLHFTRLESHVSSEPNSNQKLISHAHHGFSPSEINCRRSPGGWEPFLARGPDNNRVYSEIHRGLVTVRLEDRRNILFQEGERA